jgi:RNA polymerase sigma-70 factor (ECF subfamily)
MVVPMTPSRAEQAELHLALIRGDPTASARIFEALLSPLVERLTFKWNRLDRQALEDQATDSLIGYASNPHRYDPQRASLLTYLTLDADGDLKNAYRSTRRNREQLASDVEDAVSQRNETTDVELFVGDDRVFLARLREAFPDECDRRVIYLLLAGERSTPAYTSALGISDLPANEQRAEVKRVKDRIKKRLARLIEVDE